MVAARQAFDADPHDIVALVGDSADYAGTLYFPPLYLRLGTGGVLILGDGKREYPVGDDDDMDLEVLGFWADRWPERYSM